MKVISQMIAVCFLGAAIVVHADTWQDSEGRIWTYSVYPYGGTARINGVSPSSWNITIPRYIPSPSGYGNYPVSYVDTFNHCAGLTSVTIPNGILGAAGFNYCGDLRSVSIGKDVVHLGEVSYCDRLMSFSVADANTTYKSVSGLLLTKDGKTLVFGVNGNVTIPDGVTDINVGAFCGCSGLTSVEMPDGMLTIGKRAFYECTKLTNLVLPNSITNVGDYAFGNCSSLTSVIINGDMDFGDYAFDEYSSLTNIVIGADVTRINWKLYGCSGLTSVTIPKGVTNIASVAFIGCEGLRSFLVDTGNAVYKDEAGLLLTKDGKRLVMVPKGLRDVVIPEGVTNIVGGAFYGCKGVASVAIPGSMTSIKCDALSGCSELKRVSLVNGIRRIEYGAFRKFNSDRLGGIGLLSGTMVIPASVEEIDEGAFMDQDIAEFRFLGVCPSGLRWIQLERFGYEDYFAFSPKGTVSVYPWFVDTYPTSFSYVSERDEFSRITEERQYTPSISSNYDAIIAATPNDMSVQNGRFDITLDTPHPSVNIRYTTDGGDPAVSGTWYTQKFAARGKTTVRAIGYYKGKVCTVPATFRYAEGRIGIPEISISPGNPFYHKGAEVSITCPTDGVTIRYTTDGSIPSATNGVVYVSPFTIDKTTTVKAIAVGHASYFDSEVSSQRFERAYISVKSPVISSDSGSSFSGEYCTVSISCATDGALIYYTTDGSSPQTAGKIYAGPFKVYKTTTVRAYAIKNDYADSAIVSLGISNAQPFASAPQIGLTGGGFDASGGNRTVRIWTDEAVDAIYYTLDGSTPTEASLLYTSPFMVDSTVTVKAFSRKKVHRDSAVVSETIKYSRGMGDALGYPDLPWTAHDVAWKEIASGHAGATGLQSAVIGDGAATEISVTVVGPGTLSFWWKTSCQYDNLREYYYDHAEFWVDELCVAMLDGESEWEKITQSINGEGVHRLMWRYVKDEEASVGLDCVWLSGMQWGTKVSAIVYENLRGAANPNPMEYQEGTPFTFATPGKIEGYTFVGWEPSGITADMTGPQMVTANWVAVVAPTESNDLSNLSARLRYPWDGKLDISYEVIGNLHEGRTPTLKISAEDRLAGTNYVADVSAISGDTGIDTGVHQVVWDLNAQGIELASDDVVITVAYCVPGINKYCVIDLSAGANAVSYPVTYMAAEPSGGFNTDEFKTTKLVLRRIEPCSFMMCGQYEVTFTKSFYCGLFEVTQKQYELVTGLNPSRYEGDKRPVEHVSWNTIRGDSSTYDWPTRRDVDPASFMGKLRVRTGLNFDLPTEAQWECACRAGTTSSYNNGGNSENDLRLLGRYSGNRSDGKGGYSDTHTVVGSYLPNGWGLYDMHGNVEEWCLDWRGPLAGGTDPDGPVTWTDSPDRILRGGCQYHSAAECESSVRVPYFPYRANHTSGDFGFRLSRTMLESENAGSSEVGLEYILCSAECVMKSGVRNGFSAKYYDVSSSGYSIWTQSEMAMTNYFAGLMPTIVTNTVDWGSRLSSGMADYDDMKREMISAGMTGLDEERKCMLHGKYADESSDGFSVLLEGNLTVDVSGEYAFAALADDKLVVYIDGNRTCAAQWALVARGSLWLDAGTHRVAMAFYESSGRQGFLLQWKKPGDTSYSPLPQSVLGDCIAWTPSGSPPDPLPEIEGDADVTGALAGAADGRLSNHIKTAAEYNAYRGWVNAKGLDHQAAKNSPRAWFSYAIRANGLVEKKFQKDDVTIDSLETKSSGSFTFEVNVKDVQIGAGATAANLATVFDVQGSSSLDARSFSSDNVTVSLGVSANGKLTVSASPKVAQGSFFIRVRMYANADTGGEEEPVEPVSTTVTVTFDANGGSGGTPRTVVAGEPVGELPAVTRAGYAFGNWWTAANGGAQVNAHTVVTNDVTYYAHWTANIYTVMYKPGTNGSGSQQTAAKTHDVALVLKGATFTRNGYKQTGWTTSDGGTKAYDLGASYTSNAAITLYPVWTAETHKGVQLWEGGPYWAETNIGADEPWEYGYYFWWGDTIGYKWENDAWVASDGSSSNFSFDSGNAPTYDKSVATLKSEGWITAEEVLVPEHDAAHVQWGGDWRMPTSDEIDALISNCTTTWITTNGVNGRLVTGRGSYANRSIFFPAAGCGYDSSLYGPGSGGYYWSSTPHSDGSYYAWYLYFDSGYFIRYYDSRYDGQSVRPVRGFAE